ncbi:unnamed protein product [Kuraishia capsulata CBS 1993]|uniref:CRIB domain-containing protein n=1 Tax=Kuraishia capsulata CBS 1993 TaxID=1382522 RepID=W6MXB0_9ASCO|nr:uncharacterized protein KUCA_T00004558001 [Kuraishia capsulata CBS 1993]CDK28575.1 unnamed protein product [Kuraishia capsulata CBS 1993]
MNTAETMQTSPQLVTGSLWFDSEGTEDEYAHSKNKLMTFFKPQKNQEYLGNLDILPTNLAANSEPKRQSLRIEKSTKFMARLKNGLNKINQRNSSEPETCFISTPFGFSHVAHIDQETTFGLESAFPQNHTAEELEQLRLQQKIDEKQVGYSSFRTTPTGYSSSRRHTATSSLGAHNRSASAAAPTRTSSTSSNSLFTRSASNSTLSSAVSNDKAKYHQRQSSRLPSVTDEVEYQPTHKSEASLKSLRELEKKQVRMACSKTHAQSASLSLDDASTFQFPPKTLSATPKSQVSSFGAPSELMHTPSLPGPPTETIPWNSPDSNFFVRQSWIYENIHSPAKLKTFNDSTTTLDPASYTQSTLNGVDEDASQLMSLNAGKFSKTNRESIRKSYATGDDVVTAFRGLGLDTKELKMRQSMLLPGLEAC